MLDSGTVKHGAAGHANVPAPKRVERMRIDVLSIVTQHHVGRTRGGRIVKSTGATAVGMGFFFVGGALLMASLALPQRFRLAALTVGAIVMVGGILAAVFIRTG